MKKELIFKVYETEFQECLDEFNEDIEKALEEYLIEEGALRDHFIMNDWDECDLTTKFFEWKGKMYKVSIFEEGIIEVTNSHRIANWKVKVLPI